MKQRIRKTLLVTSFLLFPVTIWYFSPYLIIQAASRHIMNGSFLVFSAMLVLSMFLGRVWCGYLCPAGGLQECLFMCNPNPARQGWRNQIKYVIWIVWIAAIVVTFILGKNDVTIHPFLYDGSWDFHIEHIQLCDLLWSASDSCASGVAARQAGFLSLHMLDGSVYGAWKCFGKIAASAAVTY